MSTRRQVQAFRAKQAQDSAKYLESLGYKSQPFEASYKGGKCGITGETIQRGAHVAYFRDLGLCLTPAIERMLFAEREAARPACKCGGRPVVGMDKCQACVLAEVFK